MSENRYVSINVAVVSQNIGREAFSAIMDSVVFFPSLEKALKSAPNILIVDERELSRIHDEQIKVLVVGEATQENVLRCLSYPGFCGFVIPSISPNLMQKAILKLQDNEIWITRDILSAVFEEFSRQVRKTKYNKDLLNSLTRREREVVKLMSKGLSNKVIAATLHVSESTVKNHLYNIFKKIGASSRVEALSLLRE
ncbi:MAG: response regulator transcription factor [Thermodesulfovibrionales bacterium]|nr:response regulator transcription factor [Thermodesulfovibrionales bacterium]